MNAIGHDTTSITGTTESERRPVGAVPRCLGRYQLAHALGSGGCGCVFAGYDPKLARAVAIKVFHQPTPLADVEREAAALAIVAHPNVVAVHDVGDVDGLGFLVMDLMPGTLAEFMGGEHGWREIVDIFVQVGRGLAVVHAAGIAHGDIKPKNILLDSDGRPLIADFGLASASPDPAQRGGTRSYMAPERIAGAPPDAASDQFSFCVTAWEALRRVRPWDSNTATSVSRPPARRGRPRETIPASLDRVLLRGLAVDPRARFESMGALVDALGDVGNQVDRRQARRRSIATITLASLALAGLLNQCT